VRLCCCCLLHVVLAFGQLTVVFLVDCSQLVLHAMEGYALPLCLCQPALPSSHVLIEIRVHSVLFERCAVLWHETLAVGYMLGFGGCCLGSCGLTSL
jgi:hypothetical protein